MRSHRNLRKRDFLAGFEARRVGTIIETLQDFLDGYEAMTPERRREFDIRHKDEMASLKRWLAS